MWGWVFMTMYVLAVLGVLVLLKRWRLPLPEYKNDIIEDGHGSYWFKCNADDCDLHVVRPGKAQCHGRCEFDDHQGWMQDVS